jgi:hypothetical protein
MTVHLPIVHLPSVPRPDADRLPAPVTAPILAGGVLLSGAALAVRFGAWLVAERMRTGRRR